MKPCSRALRFLSELLTVDAAHATALNAALGGSRYTTLVVQSREGMPVRARSVVFAPGAWLSTIGEELLGLSIPTQVSAETVCYYAPKDGKVDHRWGIASDVLTFDPDEEPTPQTACCIVQ